MSAPNAQLIELLSAADRILVFTGAGISTGSGIADYRGPQGHWKTHDPVLWATELVTPAQAGVHAAKIRMDSRFRGNDPEI